MRSKVIVLVIGLMVAAALPVSGVQAQAEGLSPEAQLAMQHLGVDESTAVVTDEYTSDHNGVTHVYLRQLEDGVPVAGAEATVNIQNGAVIHSGSRFVSSSAITGEAVLTKAQARAAALDAVKDSNAALVSQPELLYRTVSARAALLVYDVQVRTARHWWNLSVDAETGAIAHRFDYIDSESAGEVASRIARPVAREVTEALIQVPNEQAQDGSSYLVYALPLESPNDGDRHYVYNPADAQASPFGWHDTNGQPGPEYTITRGNNVNAYADTAADNAADPGSQPDGGSGLDFQHPIVSYDLTPATYRDAAVDNLFYMNNVMHDVTFGYGFNEEAGNFQETNYTGTGTGGDPVLAEAQDGSFVLNANFATPPDGGSGRMQMFLWVDAFDTLSLRTPDVLRTYNHQIRDGDVDNGVIAHEYGHGVSNRMVGGPTNVECLRSHDEREGEGWSDFWSYALTMRPGEDGTTPRGIGTYVVYHEEGRRGRGIRITPYSTDMRINPTTYDVVKTAAEPHGVGYVWATMLWDLYWNLTEKYGFNPNPYGDWDTGGNNLTMQLVVDGMKFAPCEPGFVDARDAIIAADAALTGDPASGIPGDNECLIWETFARRGLGVDAVQGSHESKTDGRDGFAVPEHCST